MKIQVCILSGLIFASTNLFAEEVRCPNQYDAMSPEIRLVSKDNKWILTVGPLLRGQVNELLKDLPLPSDLDFGPSLNIEFPKNACILSGKGDAAFSCEGGWGQDPAVAFPLSVTDNRGKERAHFTVSKIAVDLSKDTVEIPRVKFGDVTWQLYRLTLYATVDAGRSITIHDQPYQQDFGLCYKN